MLRNTALELWLLSVQQRLSGGIKMKLDTLNDLRQKTKKKKPVCICKQKTPGKYGTDLSYFNSRTKSEFLSCETICKRSKKSKRDKVRTEMIIQLYLTWRISLSSWTMKYFTRIF